MATERRDDKIVFEIRAHLGEISSKKDGWKKELNLVSWNGQEPPKFDIREWSLDHTKMSRGITLFDNEMRKLTQYYNQFCNARTVSESKNSTNAAAKAGLKAGEEPGGARDAGDMPSVNDYLTEEVQKDVKSAEQDKAEKSDVIYEPVAQNSDAAALTEEKNSEAVF